MIDTRKTVPVSRRLVVVALVLVMAGVGFCLFDGEAHAGHDRHGVSPDLCHSVLGTTLGSAASLTGPLFDGWAADAATETIPGGSPRVPAPPPRAS
jgi:hypothetical protein